MEECRGKVAAVTEDDAIVLLDDGRTVTVSIPDGTVAVVGMPVTVIGERRQPDLSLVRLDDGRRVRVRPGSLGYVLR